jgi:prepilin-type N-terminal cleavage/methylation domain-containing protein
MRGLTKLRNKPFHSLKGFTLIELIVVIAIIGVLASLIIVSLISTQSKARDVKRKTNARHIDSSLAQYYLDNSSTFPAQNVAGGVNVETIQGNLSPTYLGSTSAFIHDKAAKYITTQSGSNFAQAWELENINEAPITKGNGVYSTISVGIGGIVTSATPASAFNFDGTTNNISIANNATYQSASFSVGFWVKPSVTGGNRVIIHKNNAGSGWRVYLNGTTITADYQAFAGSATHATAIAAGSWSHVVAVFNNTTGQVTLYVNRVAGTASAIAFGGANTTNANAINIATGAGMTNFSGTIDDVRLYNRVLTGTEIDSVYNFNSGDSGAYGSSGEIAPGVLAGGWRLDDGTGAVAANYSTVVVNGTINGTLTASSWTTGKTPLGLTGIGSLVTGKSFVTYGPQ